MVKNIVSVCNIFNKRKELRMSKFILELTTGIKDLFREKINLVIILLIVNLSFSVYSYSAINANIANSTVVIKKKVDHRYFNTTTSLEEIHNVKIDTYKGELKQRIK